MSEAIPTQQNLEEKLQQFRAEIAVLQAKEEKKELPTAHFRRDADVNRDFNPTELTEEDMQIYEKVRNRTLTFDELARYREGIRSEADREDQARRMALWNRLLAKEITTQQYNEQLTKLDAAAKVPRPKSSRAIFGEYVVNEAMGFLYGQDAKKKGNAN